MNDIEFPDHEIEALLPKKIPIEYWQEVDGAFSWINQQMFSDKIEVRNEGGQKYIVYLLK